MKILTKQHDKKKGFTLVELLVVLVIMAVLMAAIIPSVLGFIDESKRQLCHINRMQIVRFYKTWQVYFTSLGTPITLKAVFDGQIEETAQDVKALVCPSGGVYTVDEQNERIACSIAAHEGTPSGGTGGSGSLPGTNIPLTPGIWPQESEFNGMGPNETLSRTPGGVFAYTDSNYYVITEQVTDLRLADATGGPLAYITRNPTSTAVVRLTLVYLSPKNADINNQLMNVHKGDVFQDSDGKAYVYKSTGGNYVPAPKSGSYNANVWYLLS